MRDAEARPIDHGGLGDHIAHPSGTANASAVATILGGPALLLFGHALFKLSTFERISVSRLVTVAVLAGLALVGGTLSPLALTVGATLTIGVIAVWDRYAHRESAEGIPVSATAE